MKTNQHSRSDQHYRSDQQFNTYSSYPDPDFATSPMLFPPTNPPKKKIQEGGRPSLNPAIWEIADELELHAALTEKN